MWGVGEHTRQLAKHLKELGVESKTFYGSKYPEKNLDVSTTLWLHNLKQLRNFDIIHVQSSPCGAFAKIVGKPIVTTVHTTLKAELQYDRTVNSLVGLPFEEMTLRNSGRLIAVNNIVVDELVELYGYKREEINLILNAVDVSEFDKYTSVGSNPVFVMSCGRQVARKGFKYLIEACKKLNVPLKIFHGELSRSELIEQYKKATVFVCPSLYESFGFTVVEAMACKCPVLCSDIPVMKELVDDCVTGMLFPVGDSKLLGSRLEWVLSNADFREFVANNAYEFVKNSFSWDDVAKKTLAVYEELI